MDVGRYRLMSRAGFFIGAMIACFGLGLHLMGNTIGGVVLLIIGVAMLVICFSLTRFFWLLSVKMGPRPAGGQASPEEPGTVDEGDREDP